MIMNYHFIMFSILKGKTIYQRCIEFLLTEVYKCLNGLISEVMNEVFYLRLPHG